MVRIAGSEEWQKRKRKPEDKLDDASTKKSKIDSTEEKEEESLIQPESESTTTGTKAALKDDEQIRTVLREVDPSKAYRLLEAGPIVVVTTSYKGRPNIMTMGFHMMIQHDPPLIGCIIGPWDHSYKSLLATRECVIAIPTVDLARKVVDIGNCSGDKVNKFAEFGLTMVPASKVKAPLIKECLANIECKVVDTVEKYNLFVLKAVSICIDDERKERRTLHHNGDGTFTVDGTTINLRDRMVRWKEYQVEL